MKSLFIYISFFLFLFNINLSAQEHEKGLMENALLKNYKRASNDLRSRITLTLPFFEDFTDEGYYPKSDRWQDSMVFINNTLGKNIKSLGVATFDAINAKGEAYSPNNPFLSVLADSLTSHYFDLSQYSPSDSIYLSFLYQGKGNGYTPSTGDSLMVFFQRGNGNWTKMWTVKGAAMNTFYTAMIPIKDTSFFHTDFRFRIVNKATFNVGNAHWHVDYINLAANRNYGDSLFNDVAFTYRGANNFNTGLLKEYTAMPYAHFDANRNQHYSGTLGFSLWNAWLSTHSLQCAIQLRNTQTNATYSGTPISTFIQYNDAQTINFTIPNIAPVLNASQSDAFDIEVEAYLSQAINGDYSQANDTIRYKQHFDNYFAYDDGSAEGAYYMTSYQGAPAYVAQEYALTVSDTLRGVQIYFPRQVPDAINKMFYIQIYKKIDAVDGVDEKVYEQRDLYPEYEQMQNGFITYRFDNPLILAPGSFYVALMFPAGGFSDSLYIGLDKNKQGANYRYFKVTSNWEPSMIDGALMVRPLVGKQIPLNIKHVDATFEANVYPNPSKNLIHIKVDANSKYAYRMIDAMGKTVLKATNLPESIDISSLADGIYYLQIKNANGTLNTKKIIKTSN